MRRATLRVIIVIWIIIAVALTAILALAIFFRGIGFSGGSISGNMETLLDQTCSVDGIDKVSLMMSSDEVSLHIGGDDQVRVLHLARGYGKNEAARVDKSGGRLRITRSSGASVWRIISFGNRRSRIDIWLPGRLVAQLDVDLRSGELRFEDDFAFTDLAVELSSGIVRCDGTLTASEADIRVMSGKIELGALHANRFSLATSSGVLRVDDLTGVGGVNVTSGTIQLNRVELGEYLDVDVSSGTVKIGIAGDPAFQFSGKRTSGSIKAYFDLSYSDKLSGNVNAAVGDDPQKRLNVEVTSGTVNIFQTS